jgi:hypothetical protein
MGIKRTLTANLIPSIAEMFFTTILLFLFFSDNSVLLGDCDTGYHIRAGEYMIRTGSVLKFDVFSFHTPPIPWTTHEWLSEVIMAAVHSRSGMTGVVAFFAFLLALTFYLLFKILRTYQTDIVLCILVTSLALECSKIHWLARPHVFSFLLMVICHYLLESWQRDKQNRLYFLPPLMLLWVNLHGGFLGGFLLMGAYLGGALYAMLSAPLDFRESSAQKVKQLGITIVACLAASLINPSGYHILLFPFKLVSDSFIMDHVSEFLSPDFHKWMPFKYLLLLLIAMFALSRRSIEATELLLVLAFTNMALYSARYIPLFALVTAPLLTRKTGEAGHLFSDRMAQRYLKVSNNISRIDDRTTGWLWPAAALLCVAVVLQAGRFERSFDAKVKPVAACQFLMRERIAGNMFNNDEFGDYLIYRSYPVYKVFFDGRSDMYGPGRLREYETVVNFEPGWELVLEKYRITWILFDAESRLSRFLLKDQEWVLIYSDQVASIFVKNLPQYKELIGKYRRGPLAAPDTMQRNRTQRES